MFKALLEIPCKKPKIIEKSLEPDIKKDEKLKISISSKKDKLLIKIEAKNISHMKGVINTYLSLVKMLSEVDTVE